MMTDVADIATPELVTDTGIDGERLEARLIGCAEPANIDDLATYLVEVHRAALEAHVTEVVVDIRSVEFMSAACLRSLLAWIDERKRVARYRTRVVWDAAQPWQRRSLQNLVSSAGELLALE